jgi:hypothetical protein
LENLEQEKQQVGSMGQIMLQHVNLEESNNAMNEIFP